MSETKSPYVVKRLETMLNIWEQVLFVANAETRFDPEICVGAVKNWRQFRKSVFDRTKPINIDDYDMLSSVFRSYFGEKLTYAFLPDTISKWSQSSRRVYALSKDMQIDLELTSVAKVTWNDINPPFPCFVINLPIPIPGMHHNLIDTLFVEIRKGYVRIVVMGDELDRFQPMPQQVRSSIAIAAKNANIAKVQARCQDARSKNYLYVPATQYIELIHVPWEGKEIVSDKKDVQDVIFEGDMPTEEDKRKTLRFWLPIYRIVFGLCLHLEHLQRSNIEETVPESPTPFVPLSSDARCTMSTDEMFVINCEHTLTSDERRIHEIIRRVGSIEALREIGAHFRPAHWRRPPGKGYDLNYPKSVRVRWTIVNEDRLPAHSLPFGTLVNVS